MSEPAPGNVLFMPHALWTGSIAFGLVNAPVRLYSAISERDLELHLVHVRDGSRIGYQKVCKAEDRVVPSDEIAKAYELDGELVLLFPEDFRAAEQEGYKSIEILAFVETAEIDPMYYERSFLVGPQESGEKVYALLVEAMERAGLAAVVRFVFHDREYLGTLRVREGVLVLARMYFADEIRSAAGVVPAERPAVDEREVEMALELVSRFQGSFDHSAYEDQYRARLLEVIEAKRRGGETRRPPSEERPESPDLLEALRASVERYTGRRAAAADGNAAPADELDELTVDELVARARELKITGRSTMTKAELVKAIAGCA